MSSKIIHFSVSFQLLATPALLVPRANTPIFTLIGGLRDLRSISLPIIRIPQRILIHYAHPTHTLTSLGIHVPSYDVDAFTVLRFSNLKKFDLTADSWSSITSILSSMNCTFTALSVCCLDKSESLSDLRTLLTILRCSFGSLTTIHLESRKTSFDSFDVGMEVRDAFHSLLTLKFAFMKELLEAGSAWPLLESFRVDVSHFLGKTV